MHLPLYGQADTVNAFQQLEDPTQSWRRCGLVDLIRYGLMVLGQLRSQSTLRHGVHEGIVKLMKIADRPLPREQT